MSTPDSIQKELADVTGKLIGQQAAKICEICADVSKVGIFPNLTQVGRFGEGPDAKVGIAVAIVCGEMSDADMRRFRDFVNAFNQDLMLGKKGTSYLHTQTRDYNLDEKTEDQS